MSSHIGRRSSLRESLSKFLARRSTVQPKVNRLRGRYLFRAAVRLVLEYMEWIVEEPPAEEITDDVTINIRIAQKRVEKKPVTLKDRSILLIRPSLRTTAEVTHIFELMKKLRAFKKYPDNFGESLAAACIYQYFPAGRVIVRQGHTANNLYFIANGTVGLSRTEIDKLTGETKEIDMGTMNPGDTFGEIALLHVIPRSATVVSKTSVDLLLIPCKDFDAILRCTLMEEWDVLQDALVHFNYFKCWDQETIRECCILSRLKDFKADEVLLGDGRGMINYVHFVLEGECRLIEHMLVRERYSSNKTMYELYESDGTSLVPEKATRMSLRKADIPKDKLQKVEYESSSVSIFDETEPHEESATDYAHLLLSSRLTDKHVDVERTSIITTTLLDIVNEWHEITDVAAMLMREPSSISQQCYPSDVRTIFMQICTFSRGACFGLGEKMLNRRIVSVTPVRCFLIPRYWLVEHNRANIWERVKLFMDSKYPSRQQLFKEFVRNRRWINHKKKLVNDIIKNGRRIHSNTTIHDIPYSIRIANDFHLSNI